MTADNREVRDELAKLMGWRPVGPTNQIAFSHWVNDRGDPYQDPDGFLGSHPIPNTLDSADAAMPEGWDWVRVPLPPFPGKQVFHWYATNSTFSVEVPDTGDRKADLFALALAARKAQEPRNV